MPAEELQIIVRLRDQASTALRTMGKGLGTMRENAGLATSAMFSLKSAIAALGAGVLARNMISVASSFEDMRVKLDALTKGRGTQTLDEINAWAKNMPVNTQQAVETFAMMQAMGLNPTIEKMQTLTDVSVLFGEQAMPRVARALGQMATLGRLSAEELNQMSEAGINARKYLTEAFGKSVEEIQKAKIPIDQVINAIWRGLDAEFSGASAQAQSSWRGLMTQLQSEFIEFQRLIMDAGVFDFLKAAIADLTDFIKQFSSNTEFAAQVGQQIVSVLENVIRAAGYASDAFRGWKIIFSGVEALLGTIGLGFTALAEQVVSLVTFIPRQLESAMRAVGLEVSIITDGVETINRELGIAQDYFADVATNAADAAVQIANSASGAQQAELIIQRIRQRVLDWAIAQKEVKKQVDDTNKALATPASRETDKARRQRERQEQQERRRQEGLAREEANRRVRELQATAPLGEAGLSAEFQQQLIQMDQLHDERLSRLQGLKASEAEIEDEYRVQQLEKERLFADQRRQIMESILTVASNVTGGVAKAFSDLYQATGRKNKVFFALYKAASIVQAIIDTYKAANAAYAAMAGIPYVGPALGAAAAGVAIAGGMARVAMIRAQQLATGGEVAGSSPHSRADNIPIMATAGEFMQPVDAVRHYGMGAMEALRQKAVPRSLLAGFNFPVNRMPRSHFQTGGAVTRPAINGAANGQPNFNITNVVDPNLFGQYLTTAEGRNQFINFISEDKQMIRNILFNTDG